MKIWILGTSLLAAVGLAACGGGGGSSFSGNGGGSGSGGGGATKACGYYAECNIDALAYGAGVFVAVGSGTTSGAVGPWVETSTDGVTWAPVSAGYSNPGATLNSVAYGPAGFVATDGYEVIHSSDGKVWVPDSVSSSSLGVDHVAYDGAHYLLYMSGTSCATPWKESTDGKTWTSYGKITYPSGQPGEPCQQVKVGSSFYSAWNITSTSESNYVTATSSDGFAWTPGNANASSFASIKKVINDSGTFVAFGQDQYVSGSTFLLEGIILSGSSFSSMTQVTLPGGNDGFIDGASNGSVFVARGNSIVYSSPDGATWTAVDFSKVVKTNANCTNTSGKSVPCVLTSAIVAQPGGSILIALGPGGGGVISTDGVHWSVSHI